MSNFDPRTARLLPKEEWQLALDGDRVAATIYEHPHGWGWTVLLPLADLPNEIVTAADLARFGIALPAREAAS